MLLCAVNVLAEVANWNCIFCPLLN